MNQILNNHIIEEEKENKHRYITVNINYYCYLLMYNFFLRKNLKCITCKNARQNISMAVRKRLSLYTCSMISNNIIYIIYINLFDI